MHNQIGIPTAASTVVGYDMFHNYPDVLSIDELQQALNIGRTTAYRLINSGEINHLRIGKSIKIPKIYLVDYVTDSCYNISVATNLLSSEVK